MTSEQRELLQRAMLRVFQTNNSRFGLGVPAVCHGLTVYGFPDPDAEVVKDEIGYLEGKGLLEEVLKKISRENRAWRITGEGLALIDRGG
jgi:hypothetical protein